MVFSRTLLGVALAVAAAVACVPRGPRPAAALAPEPSRRCFALRFGPWTAGDERLDLYQPLPEGVELTDSVLYRYPQGDVFHARRWPSDSLRRAAAWGRAAGDSIWLRFPSHWSTGVVVTLLPSTATGAEAGALRGAARIYVDYEPFTPPRASVTAVRSGCDPAPGGGDGGEGHRDLPPNVTLQSTSAPIIAVLA